MKFSIILMLSTFILLLISIVGMVLGNPDFQEMHEIVGPIFIALIFWHLYLNRAFIKNMVHKNKKDL